MAGDMVPLPIRLLTRGGAEAIAWALEEAAVWDVGKDKALSWWVDSWCDLSTFGAPSICEGQSSVNHILWDLGLEEGRL